MECCWSFCFTYKFYVRPSAFYTCNVVVPLNSKKKYAESADELNTPEWVDDY